MKKFLIVIFIVALSFFAFKPLLVSGFFTIHDDTQIARVYEMTKALKDGMFPVRWSQDLGYGFGYPIFNFYDPLPYYSGGLFSLLGADPLLSAKLMVVLGIVISSLSMYILASEFWGALGGILSSALYSYSVYHAVDVFVRGDFAEAFAFAFIPLVFYGIWKIHKSPKNKFILLTAVSYALIIISHNLTALMVTPFVILFIFYLLFNTNQTKRQAINFATALIVGLIISAFYWIPALFEMKYTNVLAQVGGNADFRDHFVCIPQLWSSTWGYGGSAKGCADGLSFMIGKIHIVLSSFLFLLYLTILFSKKYFQSFKKYKDKLNIVVLFYLAFLISIFLMLDISKPIWEIIKPMSFLQYPWRFLLLVVFFSSFVCGSLVLFLEKLTKKKYVSYLIIFFIIILLIYTNSKYFKPQFILDNTASDYTNSYSLKWTTSKISDEYMPKGFDKPKSFEETADFTKLNNQNLQVLDFHQKTQEIVLNLNAKKNSNYILPTAYFPSWKATLDGKDLLVSEDKKGISIRLPAGTHTLVLKFVETNVELFSDLISMAAILGLLGYNLKKHD